MPYSYGSTIRVSAQFAYGGLPFDTIEVKCSVIKPNTGTVLYVYGQDAEIVREGIGQFYIDLNANEVGGWSVIFYYSASASISGQTSFTVTGLSLPSAVDSVTVTDMPAP
jgi:hypothetical protein